MGFHLADPVGQLDIANRLGVSAPAVANWRKRHADFPAPVLRISNGIGVWEWSEVKLWAWHHAFAR